MNFCSLESRADCKLVDVAKNGLENFQLIDKFAVLDPSKVKILTKRGTVNFSSVRTPRKASALAQRKS